MTHGECQNCGARLKDGWTLCAACRRQYAQTLHSLRIALRNLRQVANREVTLGSHGHADPAVPQTPVNLTALDLYDTAWETIRQVAATIGLWGDGDRLITRMQARMADLCRTATAGRDNLMLARLLERASRASDRREHKPFAGRCPECGRNIEAMPEETIARCECGSVVDCTALRENTMREFDRIHITETPAGAARWCADQTGVNVTRKDIANWMRRGLDAMPDGERCYRYPIGQLLRHARDKGRRLHTDAIS